MIAKFARDAGGESRRTSELVNSATIHASGHRSNAVDCSHGAPLSGLALACFLPLHSGAGLHRWRGALDGFLKWTENSGAARRNRARVSGDPHAGRAARAGDREPAVAPVQKELATAALIVADGSRRILA
jgi:hypothetical protein